jgi:hypothetical protein
MPLKGILGLWQLPFLLSPCFLATMRWQILLPHIPTMMYPKQQCHATSEIMIQSKPFLLLSWLIQLVCYSDDKLTSTTGCIYKCNTQSDVCLCREDNISIARLLVDGDEEKGRDWSYRVISLLILKTPFQCLCQLFFKFEGQAKKD